jgi:hypothetical protein
VRNSIKVARNFDEVEGNFGEVVPSRIEVGRNFDGVGGNFGRVGRHFDEVAGNFVKVTDSGVKVVGSHGKVGGNLGRGKAFRLCPAPRCGLRQSAPQPIPPALAAPGGASLLPPTLRYGAASLFRRRK